ncbi:MAG TPA: AI-2E family transporter [Casimicrobiaceae bacterium]|nr:AI-2E family transporter [Casimicrobiaceae bacterium]
MSERATAKRAPASDSVAGRSASARGKELPAAAAPVLAPKLTVIEVTAIAVAAIAIIAAARVAESFFVPVVAGILLSYALRPLVSAIERWRLPRLAAAALVMTVLVGVASGIAYAIHDDVNAAVAELPGAARKLRMAIADSERQSPGPISHVKAAAEELDRAAAEATGKPATIKPPSDAVAAQFQTFVEQQSAMALSVLTEILFAMLLAFFLLAAGDTFRRKVAKLAGESLARRRVTVEVLNEIDAQIQKYLVTLLFANTLIGLTAWGSLALLGLPNAGMWGAITGVLHVIPYAGAFVAAVGVGVAMFLHSGSLAPAAMAMGAVAVISTLIGIGYSSWLQGRASRMNAVAVFIGVLFFGWLWGGWGLLLGLPIIAVVKSIGDRVEPLHPLSELLGV